MIAPAEMMIDTAQGRLADEEYRKAHAWVWPAQLKELKDRIPDASEDFQKGYELGLQTARVLLEEDPKALKAGVSF